jgi:peptide/nickel transport system substrate-binding protein
MASAPIDRRGITRKSFLKASVVTLAAASTTDRLVGVTALAQTRPHAPRVGGTLRFGYPLDFTRDDPVNAPWMDDSDLQIYERLLAKDFHGNLVPQLAESFHVSSDGLTLTFTLKHRNFQNGHPVTAAAVKEFFLAVREPKNGHPWRYYDAVTRIDTPDARTLVFHLAHPDANLPQAVSYTYAGIVDMTVRAKYGNTFGTQGDVGAGSGPFALAEFVPGDHVTIVRNPAYSNPSPFVQNKGSAYLDKVVYKYIPDASQRSIDLESGNVDLVQDPAPQDVARLKGNSDLAVLTLPEWSLMHINFNFLNKHLADRTVRQAIIQAIDRRRIVEKVLFNQGTPAYSVIPAQDKTYWPGAEALYPYDLARAKQLMNGRHFTFTLIHYQESEHRRLAQVIQAELAQIGITLKLQALDRATHFARLKAGTYDLAFFKYLWDSPMDVVKVEWWSKQIPFPDWSRYRSAADSIFPRLDSTRTLGQRADLSVQIQRILMKDIALVPIYTPYNIYAYNKKRVHGFHPYTFSLYAYLQDVYLT